MNRLKKMLSGCFLFFLDIPAVFSDDHGNLDTCQPLCAFEDTYPIKYGEAVIELGAGYADNRFWFPTRIVYGASPNLEIGIGIPIFTDQKNLDGPERAGGIALEGLYNFNMETTNLPALSIKFGIGLPTGIGSYGTVFSLAGLATKSWGDISFHLNVGYTLWERKHTVKERDGIYLFALGLSYPIGVPDDTRTTLVADVYTRQSWITKESNIYGLGVGFRYQLYPNTVLSFGGGPELISGKISPSLMLGISWGF